MTRVLCVTSWYPPHHFGGYELSCQDVMTRLAERGDHVEVLTSDHRHDDVDDGDPAPVAAVHRDLRLYVRDGQLWSPPVWQRLRVERDNQAALDRALAVARPDVVAFWHVGAMSLGLVTAVARRGLPTVFAVSDDWPTYATTLDAWTRAVQRLRGLAPVVERVTGVPATVPDLDGCGGFGFISEVTRSRCREKSPWDFPVSGLVYSGIDGRLFDLAGLPDAPPERPWRGRLLYVGRPDPRKGIRTLVEALAHLPGCELVVDGRGSDEETARVRAWAAEAGVGDRVAVQCSDRADLPSVYADADVCVFPSEWAEPFGLVPLEAMACSTPVVASGVGGSGEFLVDEGNSLLFEPGDPASLAGAVRRLADDPGLRRRVVAGGYTTARFFDSDHLADAFAAWHDAAVRGWPDGAVPDRRPPSLAVPSPGAP